MRNFASIFVSGIKFCFCKQWGFKILAFEAGRLVAHVMKLNSNAFLNATKLLF